MKRSFKSILPFLSFTNPFSHTKEHYHLTKHSAAGLTHALTGLGAPTPQTPMPLALMSLPSPGAAFFLKISLSIQALKTPWKQGKRQHLPPPGSRPHHWDLSSVV